MARCKYDRKAATNIRPVNVTSNQCPGSTGNPNRRVTNRQKAKTPPANAPPLTGANAKSTKCCLFIRRHAAYCCLRYSSLTSSSVMPAEWRKLEDPISSARVGFCDCRLASTKPVVAIHSKKCPTVNRLPNLGPLSGVFDCASPWSSADISGVKLLRNRAHWRRQRRVFHCLQGGHDVAGEETHAFLG